MSDLDTLIVTFQTQLSDVMETVVKTAMYEVTRLVETGLFEEVKRRNQEVESLRMQLQWAKRKLSHQVRKNVGKCGNCIVRDELNLSDERDEEGSQELQDDILSGWHASKEGDGIEKWPKNNMLNIKSEATPEVGEPTVACSPDRDTQIMEKQEEIKAADVKEEEVTKLSCSSAHVGGWTVNADAGSVLHSEMTEEHAEQTEESSQSGELLRTVIKQDQQISPTYVFPEDQKDLNMTIEPSVDIDPSWASLTITAGRLRHDHTLRTERDDDLTKSWDALSQAEHEQSDSVTVKASACRPQLSSSDSSNPRLQNTDPLHVTIKQEVVVDSDGCDSDQRLEKKAVKRSGMTSFSYSLKRNKVSSEVQKQNQDSHKATVQELMKLHSKAGTGLRLQAAIQHLQRPMKKNPQAHINSTTAAMSFSHSQVVNLNPLNRIPSTSKAGPSLTLSVQRVHPPGKQAMASNRTSTSWVKSSSQNQSTNSHHTNPLPHSDSHPIPRHPLRCGQCGKCFPHPSNLKAHLQTHTGERPFCCSLCGRSFTKLSNLKAHRRVHTGERPYCCLACGKRFTQKCNLKRHQRIHLEG